MQIRQTRQDRQWTSNSSSGASVSVIPEHHSEITATLHCPVIDCEPDTDREEGTPTTREVLMGVGDGVASVIMLTFTKRPGPHADFYSEARPPC